MTVTLKIRLPRWCNVSVYNTCAEVLGSIHGSDELFVWSLNIFIRSLGASWIWNFNKRDEY